MTAKLIVCPQCATANRVPDARLGDGPTCGRCKRALFAGEPIVLTDANFDAIAGRTELPFVIDFWASWCGPCRAFAPTFAQAAARLEPGVRLAKVDSDANPALSQRFGIRSIPTLVAVKGGREVARVSGAMPLETFLEWTKRAIA